MPFLQNLVAKGKKAIIKSGHIPIYSVSHDLINFPYQNEEIWGRHYYDEDLRSNGFYSGIAYENDIVVPLEGAVLRDIMMHEISHQVQANLFPPELNLCIEELYNQALEKNNFVSAYGSTDLKEYFAESMTAYSLQGKIVEYYLPNTKYNWNYLKNNDPDMFLLAQIIEVSQGQIDKISCPLKNRH